MEHMSLFTPFSSGKMPRIHHSCHDYDTSETRCSDIAQNQLREVHVMTEILPARSTITRLDSVHIGLIYVNYTMFDIFKRRLLRLASCSRAYFRHPGPWNVQVL